MPTMRMTMSNSTRVKPASRPIPPNMLRVLANISLLLELVSPTGQGTLPTGPLIARIDESLSHERDLAATPLHIAPLRRPPELGAQGAPGGMAYGDLVLA